MAGPLVAVVLAAGASTRLGEPKQLLRSGGRTLVARAAESCLASRCDEVIVVVGAEEARVREALQGMPVRVVTCEGWREGIAASIRSGVEAALPEAGAVLVVLADQLRVGAAQLDRLAAAWLDEGRELVASGYAGGLGVPALFAGAHLPALLALRGDRGARDYLALHAGDVRRVDLPEAEADVDVPEDLDRLG